MMSNEQTPRIAIGQKPTGQEAISQKATPQGVRAQGVETQGVETQDSRPIDLLYDRFALSRHSATRDELRRACLDGPVKSDFVFINLDTIIGMEGFLVVFETGETLFFMAHDMGMSCLDIHASDKADDAWTTRPVVIDDDPSLAGVCRRLVATSSEYRNGNGLLGVSLDIFKDMLGPILLSAARRMPRPPAGILSSPFLSELCVNQGNRKEEARHRIALCLLAEEMLGDVLRPQAHRIGSALWAVHPLPSPVPALVETLINENVEQDGSIFIVPRILDGSSDGSFEESPEAQNVMRRMLDVQGALQGILARLPLAPKIDLRTAGITYPRDAPRVNRVQHRHVLFDGKQEFNPCRSASYHDRLLLKDALSRAAAAKTDAKRADILVEEILPLLA